MRLRVLTTVLAAAAALCGPAAAEPITFHVCDPAVGCAGVAADPDQPGTADVDVAASGTCATPEVGCVSGTPGRTKTVRWRSANATVSCAVSKYTTTVSIDVGPRDSGYPVEVWATCHVHQYGVREGSVSAHGYTANGVSAHASETRQIGPLTNDAVVGCLTATIVWADDSTSLLPPCDEW